MASAPAKIRKTHHEQKKLWAEQWPFTVELHPLTDIFSDERYQRPPQETFVDKLVNAWDDTLVGVIDVSLRHDGRLAVLDGLQRLTGMKKVNKKACWCAVYENMTIKDEALFFYRKNKDRRSVHPFYSFRARMVAGDVKAKDINTIVEHWGFKLEVGARDNVITAIAAVEEAYSWQSAARTESLSPALRSIRTAFDVRHGSKEGDMIRGLGRLFQPFKDDEIDLELLHDIMGEIGPRTILGKARDYIQMNPGARMSVGDVLARDIIRVYNRRKKSGKLNIQFLHKRK